MSYTNEIKLFMQFTLMAYTSLLILTWMLPAWLGDDLSKAVPAYMVIALLPVALNIFHVVTGALPASTSQIVETLIWVVFAGLFYFYCKKPA